MTLGARHHRYEPVDRWLAVPGAVRLGYTHAIACDRQDRLHVFNQSRDAVAVFDASGRFVRSWGARFAKGAHGMVLSVEDGVEYLYLADYELPQVSKHTLDGAEVLRLPTPPIPQYADGSGYKPTHACVAPNGDIYAFDGYGKGLIHRYDRAGRHLHSWGGAGDGPGQMRCPHGGAIVQRPGQEAELYVADRANVRIQVFSLEGVHRRFLRGRGLKHPCNIVAHSGDLLIPTSSGSSPSGDRTTSSSPSWGRTPRSRSSAAGPRARASPTSRQRAASPGASSRPTGSPWTPRATSSWWNGYRMGASPSSRAPAPAPAPSPPARAAEAARSPALSARARWGRARGSSAAAGSARSKPARSGARWSARPAGDRSTRCPPRSPRRRPPSHPPGA